MKYLKNCLVQSSERFCWSSLTIWHFGWLAVECHLNQIYMKWWGNNYSLLGEWSQSNLSCHIGRVLFLFCCPLADTFNMALTSADNHFEGGTRPQVTNDWLLGLFLETKHKLSVLVVGIWLYFSLMLMLVAANSNSSQAYFRITTREMIPLRCQVDGQCMEEECWKQIVSRQSDEEAYIFGNSLV